MRKLLTVALLGLAGCYGAAEASTEQKAIVYHSGPTVSTTNNSVCVSADMSGLGNDDVNIDVSATFTATTVCRNHGGNTAPGQGVVTLNETFPTQSIQPKNGRVHFNFCDSVTGRDFGTVTPEQAGCPNGNWTVDPIQTSNISLQSYTVQISQDGNVLYSSSG